MSKIARGVLWTVVAAAAACGNAPRDGYAVRDSAGVEIVENTVPAWSGEQGWRLGDPRLDLGGSEATGPEAFRWVITAFLTPDSLLAVLQTGGDIQLFDLGGRHLATAGGQGDGPGEFRMLAGGGVTGDSLWVYDYTHRRLTYFGPRGELRGVHTLEGEDGTLLPVGRLGDRLLLTGSYRPGAAAEARRLGLRRDTTEYRLYGPEGQRGPTIGRGAAREYAVLEEAGRLTMASPPMVRRAENATVAGRWVHGDQTGRQLEVRSADGSLDRIVRWTGPDLAVTEAAISLEIERRIAELEDGDEAGLRRFLSELPHPETRPAHGRIHGGPDGTLWVETASGTDDPRFGLPGEPPGWHVFDPSGRWLGTVDAPGRFRITQVLTDAVVGVWLDPLDVEHVQIRPILRQPQR